MLAVARAVRALADAHPDTVFVWAYHPNPAVRELVEPELAGHSGIVAVPALPYHPFLAVLARSCLTITDSGGVQEAGPALDVPVLVTREVTERPEGVAAGCAALVGTTQPIIFAAAHRLLSDEPARLAMARIGCPYGDGRSGQRAAAALAWLVAGSDRPAPYQAN